MAFFKKWKITNTRHRKLTEDWALATSLKDFSELNGNGGGTEDDNDPSNDTRTEQFCVKYLGNTIIESERSQIATADAVKTVIQTAKGLGKKLKRVNLCISPKGIDVSDYVTGEQLIQISIYKISYCSADAAHGDVFAFVGSEDLIEGAVTPNNITITAPSAPPPSSLTVINESHHRPLEERLICYAFLCQKRKIAQKVTLTVARSFEQAYQIWRETTQRQKYILERRMAADVLNRRRLQSSSSSSTGGGSGPSSSTSSSESSSKTSDGHDDHHNNDFRNLLIDFSSEITAEICCKNPRDLLQNTWVSFDETINNQQHSGNNNSRDCGGNSGGLGSGSGDGGSRSSVGYMKQEVH